MPLDWSENIVVIDLSDEPALSDELASIIQRVVEEPAEKIPNVVLNFGGVSYVTSSNLAQLLKLKKRLAEAKRQLRLCAVTEEVFSVMMVTGLDKIFRFAPDPLTALAGLQLEQEKG
jgi:anti-anti-sigma factor